MQRTLCLPYGLALALLVFSFTLAGAQADSAQAASIDSTQFLSGYPLVFYFPETDWGFGAGLVLNKNLNRDRQDTRPSSVQFVGAYTLNEQLLLFAPFNLFFAGDRSLVSGEIGYYDYFYPYYGIGSNRPDTPENYFVRFPRLIANFDREWWPGVYLGAGVRFDNYRIDSIAAGGLLATNRPSGFDGSVVAGLNLRVQYDTRNNVYYPTRGWRLIGTVLLARQAIGASSNFTRWDFNGSYYQALGPAGVLAGNLVYGYSAGAAPIQELQLYGGARTGRGFVPGRFRDAQLWSVQVEYRFPLFGRLRGVAFATAGNVFGGSGRGPLAGGPKYTGGGGIRYLLNRKEQINFRLDVAWQTEGLNFYATVGEAF
jgi:hypothetical protein